jgi:hypothetical protein
MDSFVNQKLSGPRLRACSLAPRYSSEEISSATISLLAIICRIFMKFGYYLSNLKFFKVYILWFNLCGFEFEVLEFMI